MSFDGPRDWVCLISAVMLLILGALTYFGIAVPWLTWIVAVVLIVGALFGIFDSVSVDQRVMMVIYMVLFLVVVLMAINAVFMIPFIGPYISLVPVGITNYIVNAVVAVLLIAVAFQSF